jgi:hypothetical protein
VARKIFDELSLPAPEQAKGGSSALTATGIRHNAVASS